MSATLSTPACPDGFQITPADIANFNKVWMEFDFNADHYMHFSKLQLLVRRLRPPFGVATPDGILDKTALTRTMCRIRIPQDKEGQVHYIDVITSVSDPPLPFVPAAKSEY